MMGLAVFHFGAQKLGLKLGVGLHADVLGREEVDLVLSTMFRSSSGWWFQPV